MKKNYKGKNTRVNEQNAHMLKSQLNSMAAITKLVGIGVTVLEVQLGMTHPIIKVQPTIETKRLSGSIIKNTYTNNVRKSHFKAQLNECTIIWESNYVH